MTAIDRLIRYHAESGDMLLAECFAAARVVGKYERGAVEEIAARLGYDDSSMVYNLAHAGTVWRGCRKYWQDVRSRHLRPSHYYSVWKWWEDGTNAQAIAEIFDEAFAEFENPTASMLAGMCAMRFGEAYKSAPVRPRIVRLFVRLWELVERSDVTKAERQEAADHLRAAQQILTKG